MINKKKILSTAVAGIMLLSSTVSFAAQGDFYEVKDLNTIKYEGIEVLRDIDDAGLDVLKRAKDFGLEGKNNKIYSYENASKAFRDADGSADKYLDLLEEDYEELNKEDESELKVQSVSAIDDINVEFGGEYTLPAEAEVTLSDDSVVSVPVVWEDTVDVNTAGTYALVGTLDVSGLENVEATELTAKVNVVVAEFVDENAPVITLNGEAEVNLEFGAEYVEAGATAVDAEDGEVEVTVEGTVDTSVAGTYTITYTATDAAGNVATATRTVVVAEEVRIPATLTTEADATINAVVGSEVSVTYTVEDENEKPVIGTDVRVRATNIFGDVVEEQVLATDENGQVTFSYTSIDGRTDSLEAVVLSKPTLRNTAITVEWVETAAKVEVVNPTATGFIVDSATNAPAELQTMKYVATFTDENGNPLADGEVVSVDLTNVTGTLTPGADDEFTATPGSINTVTLANGDGTAVLEFTTDTAEKIKPTFFYDADNSGGLTSQDPRIVAKEVEVVDATTQEPTFELALKPVDTTNGVNDTVEEVAGGLTVQVGSTVEYTLTAKDQYGNPFIGTANLSHKVLLDNLASNDGTEGAIVFDTDEIDGGYTGTNAASVDFDAVDTDADGTIELQLSGGAAGDATNLVVWFGANQKYKVESQTVEFVAVPAAELTSMDITADLTTVVADGSNKVAYTVELKDADGNALDVSGLGDSVDVIVKLYKDGVKLDQSSSATKVDAIGTLTVGTYAAAGENIKITGINANDGKFDFTVLPVAADAGSTFNPVVYVDINKDGVIQADETMTVTGSTFAATALPNKYKVELSKTDVVAGETVDIKITAQKADASIETNFNGEHIVEVLLAADTSSAVAPAKKYLRTANFVNGVATVSVPVELIANNDVKVTMPLGTTPAAIVGTDTDNDLTITAAAASKLGVSTNDLLVVDAFGNTAKYNFTGMATVTTDGTFSGTLDAENKMQVKIVNGVVTDTSDTALTFTGAGKTLTMTLANGDVFTITR